MLTKKFRGLYVPLVTPFDNGEVDTSSLRRLATFLIDGGADGLVVSGTTGEGTALSRDERLANLRLILDEAQGSVPVIAGVSGSNTLAMVEEVKAVSAIDPDGLMITCPYYTRPSQIGLIAHFRTLAAETHLPIIVYNIRQRTGVHLETQSMVELSETENIVGIKEASPQFGTLVDLIEQTASRISVFTGEDTFIFPALCLGADGAISAAGNVLVQELSAIFRALEQSDLTAARETWFRILPMLRILFSEPNPGPMKAALSLMGVCRPEMRLPLVAASPTCTDALRRELNLRGKM